MEFYVQPGSEISTGQEARVKPDPLSALLGYETKVHQVPTPLKRESCSLSSNTHLAGWHICLLTRPAVPRALTLNPLL